MIHMYFTCPKCGEEFDAYVEEHDGDDGYAVSADACPCGWVIPGDELYERLIDRDAAHLEGQAFEEME